MFNRPPPKPPGFPDSIDFELTDFADARHALDEVPPGVIEVQQLKPGASVTASELIAHCRGLLAGYKVPKEVRFEAIPKTSTGKIQKFMLRERARSAAAIE